MDTLPIELVSKIILQHSVSLVKVLSLVCRLWSTILKDFVPDDVDYLLLHLDKTVITINIKDVLYYSILTRPLAHSLKQYQILPHKTSILINKYLKCKVVPEPFIVGFGETKNKPLSDIVAFFMARVKFGYEHPMELNYCREEVYDMVDEGIIEKYSVEAVYDIFVTMVDIPAPYHSGDKEEFLNGWPWFIQE